MSVDLLLDTHAVIWLVEGDERIRGLLPLLDDDASTVWVSSVSWTEIAIKHTIGKLDLTVEAARPRLVASNVLDIAFDANHALSLEQLPLHHADPFDRMLIAQALAEGMTIATVDASFDGYDGLSVTWPT
jgi:PIN domain nuclease of toxin-antitoxin system